MPKLPGFLYDDYFPSLSRLFPALPFTRRADKWLSAIGQKSIKQQLEEKRIKNIRVWFLSWCSGFISINEGSDDVTVVLNREEPEAWFVTLGHELGHMFHFDCRKCPPTSLVPERILAQNFESSEEEILYHKIEEFCEEFAIRWVIINGHHNIQRFWDKYKNTDFLSAK